MAITSKYYVLTPTADNLDFLDFGLQYGNVTTAGESIQFNGSSKVDSIFVRPGLSYDLTNTAGGTDKIYLTGNLGDYTKLFDIPTQVLTLTRSVGGANEMVKVASGTALTFDNLIFADGTVSTNALAVAVKANSTPPVPSPVETSLNPQGAAAPGATLNATIQAYSANTAGVGQVGETFAVTKPGINYTVFGGSGIDTVYVGNGETVDASILGASVDLVYFRGNWADYTKTLLSGGTRLQFTRLINGATESVIVTTGTALVFDKLIFADGAVTTINAKNAIATNPIGPIVDVPGVDPTTITPLYTNDEVAAALSTIRDAAEGNSATATMPTPQVYITAGVSGVTAANVAAINSALDSMPVNGAAADTAPEVQAIVDAYKAILASADGTSGNTATPLTAAQYSAVGVTGVSGTATPGSALSLLNAAVDGDPQTAVNSVGKLQALADAANHVIAAAGGTPAQIAALTQADLSALGITGTSPDLLPAVLAAIGKVTSDADVDTPTELQVIVNTAVTNASNALATITSAAQGNTAISSGLMASVYGVAGVTGVTAANQISIDLALDSDLVNGAATNTVAKVQSIVDAYNAILASADGVAGNTATALTGAQYAAIGVTGVSGLPAPGTALFLLNGVVDGKPTTAVDTVAEVQALADAANHLVSAAGGTPAQIAALTLDDLTALGITGVTPATLPAAIAGIGKTMPDSSVDTPVEIQAVVTAAITAATNALNTIAAAAEGNAAISSGLSSTAFSDAGVTGVTATNLVSIDLSLDSLPVNGAAADTTPEVQAIVNAYNAILASADGVANNTVSALTGAQYSAIGVTGVSGLSAPGTVVSLLDNVVDGKAMIDVDTVVEVQALANAANHVIAAAHGTAAQMAAVTVADLIALGVTGVTAANLAAVQAAIGAAATTDVDTSAELQALVTTAGTGASAALATIAAAAQNDTATTTSPATSVYAAAGVVGVTAANLASINSALNSAAVNGAAADTTPEVQGIVDAYNAILNSADGVAGNTATALSAAQYTAIGVTGVTGTATAGSALFLLDNVLDGKPNTAVDTEVEVQGLADAAKHVIAAAGGTAAQMAAVTVADLTTLGITGVTAGNLVAVQAAIGAAASTAVDTQAELQTLVTTASTGATNALATIAAAAQNDTATATSPAASVYAAAGVTGVTATNLASINSALDSAAVNGAAADTTPEVQGIVDAYNAILASADGVAGNTGTALSAAQYTAIGITGVTGAATAGTSLFLLDNVLDGKPGTAVDTEAKVQSLADASNHVIAAAGGTAAQIAALTLADLTALGVTGVTAGTLPAVLAAIGAAATTAVDTLPELQALVTTASTGASNALATIAAAAQSDTATATSPAASVYAAAGVTGVTATNLASINSALDSAAVNSAAADTTPEVQGIVDAYNAILNSADGVAGNTATALSAAQYTAIGVTGVTGTATAGNALFLLDNVLDGKPVTAVDTEAEVQGLADAANHVIAAAGGTAAQIAALTLTDLTALGVTGVTAGTLPAVLAAIGAAADAAVDTLPELQALVTTASTGATTALATIAAAAQNDTATATSPALSVYAAAGVNSVTATNLAAINSALDSAAVNGAAADTTPEVQGIVDAYNAILNSADGVAGNTAIPLTAAQYTTLGVTGLSGVSAAGNALHLLDDVVDGSALAAVDTVPELQAMSDAASHVIGAAAGGAGPSLADLNALGITGVTVANLASAQAAIAATAHDGTGVDTKGELQTVITTAINSHPNITSVLGGVTNLDVTSDLVFSSDQTITIGTGAIHITDLGGSNGGTGYQGDTTNNTQTIDVATAVQNGLLTITGTGANTKIIINPKWDLDLSSSYQITIDDGALMDATGTHAASHIAPINFNTVTPGVHGSGTVTTEAVASQIMVDATGALTASKSWMDIQGIGNNTGSVTQLGDLSTGAYALVMKNYATTRGGDPLQGGDQTDGIATHDTNIGVTNFGNNDVVYFDSQVNNSAIQFFDGRYTGMTDGASIGGVAGQNALVMGLVPVPTQQGSTASILLGLEGNTANTIYPSIYTIDANTTGWANVWHPNSAPVVMG